MDDTRERCPSCGEPLHADDVYCGSCGRAVGAGAAAKSTKQNEPAPDPGDQPTMMMPATGGPPRQPDLGPQDMGPQDLGADADPPLVGDTPAYNFPPPPIAAPIPTDVAQPVDPTAPAPTPSQPEAWIAAVGPPPPSKKRRSKTPWVIAAFIVLLAVIGGLIALLISKQNDLDDAKQNSSSSSQQVTDLNTVINQQQATINSQQAELDQTKGDLTKAQQDLAAEQQGRASDQEAAQKTQADLDAANAQLETLQGLFPMDEADYRGADPAGNYSVAVTPGACTLTDCGSIESMTINIPDKTRVEGDRTNGSLQFDGQSYVNQGAVAAANRPNCNGQPADATYQLAIHATGVDQSDGALHATSLGGTYTETVAGGECAGQTRSFNLALTK